MQNATERNAQCLAAGDWWFYCWLWPHRRRYSDLVYSIAGIPNILVGKLIEHHQHGSISHISILYSQLCRHIVTMRSCNWLCRSMRLSIRWIMRIYVHRSIVARIMCSCSGSRYIIHSFLISALYVFHFQLRSHQLGQWLSLFAQRLFPAPSVLLCGAHLFQLSRSFFFPQARKYIYLTILQHCKINWVLCYKSIYP